MSTVTMSMFAVAGGRRVEVAEAGPAGRPVLLFHHGTPGAAERFGPWVDAAVAAGWRWVSVTRPGNGRSNRNGGRTVAEGCGDVAAVLNGLAADEFVAVGWSGGGPYALACAALLPERCRGAITLGGVGPMDEMRRAGLDPVAGMGGLNVDQFAASHAGESHLRAFIAPFEAQMPTLDGASVSGMLASLVAGSADEGMLTGEFADDIAAGFREATTRGSDGWVDDVLAVDGPWGFSLEAIRRPVGIWQGTDDRMVPPAHGRYLLSGLPAARDHLLTDEGHLSILLHRFGEVLDEAAAFLSRTPKVLNRTARKQTSASQ